MQAVIITFISIKLSDFASLTCIIYYISQKKKNCMSYSKKKKKNVKNLVAQLVDTS